MTVIRFISEKLTKLMHSQLFGTSQLIVIFLFPFHFSTALDKSADDSNELTRLFFHYLEQNSFLKTCRIGLPSEEK